MGPAAQEVVPRGEVQGLRYGATNVRLSEVGTGPGPGLMGAARRPPLGCWSMGWLALQRALLVQAQQFQLAKQTAMRCRVQNPTGRCSRGPDQPARSSAPNDSASRRGAARGSAVI